MYKYRTLTPDEQQKLVQERHTKGHPPHQPPHFIESGKTYLLTAACYEHKPLLKTGHRRQQLVAKILDMAPEFSLTIYAWVVLNNHYHLLAQIGEAHQIRKFFQQLHGGLSFEWNREENCRGRQVWYRYGDRNIENERHYYTAINYIHYNPVKHGLVSSPYEHEESSVHWYVANFGREWLRDLWREYPIREFGVKWDVYEEGDG
jgi:putative transposase